MNEQESIGLLTPTTTEREALDLSILNHAVAEIDAIKSADDGSSELSSMNLAAELAEPGAGAGELLKLGIDWPVVVWIGLVHALALVAPFFFSWT